MKERGILFSAPMVRARRAGLKTQTRRVAKFVGYYGETFETTFTKYDVGHGFIGDPTSGWVLRTRSGSGCTEPLHSPYGNAGDRLWTRETWAHDGSANKTPGACWYRADKCHRCPPGAKKCEHGPARWSPGIHMFRWASRDVFELTGVRVERLQDISDADAIAEGIEVVTSDHAFRDYQGGPPLVDPVKSYRSLWESINGGGSWALNPFVWVLSFPKFGGVNG